MKNKGNPYLKVKEAIEPKRNISALKHTLRKDPLIEGISNKRLLKLLNLLAREDNYEQKRKIQEILETLLKKGKLKLNSSFATVRVGSTLIEGNKKSLIPLVKAQIILPLKQDKDGRWIRTTLEKTTNFYIPIRHTQMMDLFEDTHGRSNFVQINGETYFFKGVGNTGRMVIPFIFDEEAKLYPRKFLGGHTLTSAKHEKLIADEFLKAYNRLMRRKSKALQIARDSGATFAPIIKDYNIFKLEQVPVHPLKAINMHERFKSPNETQQKEIRAGRFVRESEQVKTLNKAKAYDIPINFAGEQVVACYKVKTPFRLKDLYKLTNENLFELYGLKKTKDGYYYKNVKIKSTKEIVKIITESFGARLALSFIISLEANCITGTDASSLSIYSDHNITAAGEVVDYDVVRLGIDKTNEKHREMLLAEYYLATSKCRGFYRDLSHKMNLYDDDHAEKVFINVVRQYLKEKPYFKHFLFG
jgi:hypothetical protein